MELTDLIVKGLLDKIRSVPSYLLIDEFERKVVVKLVELGLVVSKDGRIFEALK